MKDKELLEMAAKAAGYNLGIDWACSPRGIFINGDDLFSGHEWNPIADDGDALRLAVKLGAPDRVPLRICIEYQDDGGPDFTCVEHFGESTVYHTGDPAEATRRAIVIAAAEIGKSMP